MRHPEQFALTVSEKLLTYAVGRTLQYYDEPAIRKITRDAASNNYTFSSLIIGVVNSVPFQMRKPGPIGTVNTASLAWRAGN